MQTKECRRKKKTVWIVISLWLMVITGCGKTEKVYLSTEEETEDFPLILIHFGGGYLSRSLWS